MLIYKLPNAAASTVTVTNTAQNLFDLIDTAAGSNNNVPKDANAAILIAEGADVRYLADGNTPTASEGFLLPADEARVIKGYPLTKMQLIRVGGSNVSVSVIVGKVDL